jgi:hypothetical protein
VSKTTFLHREPEDLERYLLEQGRRDGGTKKARDRTIAHAGLAATAGAGLAATSITSGSAAAATAAPWALATKWIAVGVASGALTVGVAEEWRHAQPSPLPSPSAMSSRVPTRPTPNFTERAMIDEAAIAPDPPPAVIESAASAPSVVARQGRPARNESYARGTDAPRDPPRAQENAAAANERRDPPSPPRPGSGGAPESTLPFEVRMLDEARRSLQSHDGARALAALDAYARSFPAGSMRIEANALRIEALLMLGQVDSARALGRAFLAHHSSSPAAMRVRMLLEAGKVEGTNW